MTREQFEDMLWEYGHARSNDGARGMGWSGCDTTESDAPDLMAKLLEEYDRLKTIEDNLIST